MKRNLQIYPSLLFCLLLPAALLLSAWSILDTRSAEAGLPWDEAVCLADATLYVNHQAAGTDDGSSWGNAFNDLQDALLEADTLSFCEGLTVDIWVASGVYTPGASTTDSFILLDDVAIYGGFVGTETLLTERDWETNLTILSGDIDANDMTDSDGVTEGTGDIVGSNAHQIIIASSTSDSAILDGFIITGGDAIGSAARQHGGGMYNIGGDPTLANLIFVGNYAKINGGAIYNDGSNPSLQNVAFINNEADDYGGAIYNNGSSPTLSNTVFIANLAGFDGGGMYNIDESIPVITNASFKGNIADRDGGGVANHIDNSSPPRSAALIPAATSPTFINVIFSGNYADNDGGGMHNAGTNSPPPRALGAQEATALAATSPILINVTFSGNGANGEGGGLYNNSESQPTIINSIFWNNLDNSSDTLTANIANDSTSPDISYSLIQGSGGSDSWDSDSGADNGNNIDSDPLFIEEVNPLDSPTENGDLTLQLGSPAIDTGSNISYTGSTAADLASNPRIHRSIIDLGAYENQFNCPSGSTLLVDHSASGTGDGGSWANAFPLLQDALGVAAFCTPIIDEIWVASGVYTPGNTITDTFSLVNNVAIYGGFVGTETVRNERDWETNATVLSGDIGGDDTTDANGVVVTATDQVGDNSYHVVNSVDVTQTAVLDGFYVTAGQADLLSAYYYYGGGINSIDSSLSLNKLYISGNLASFGGGIQNVRSDLQMTDITVSGNSASIHGGGIYSYDSDVDMTRLAIHDNSASTNGGGVFNDRGTITITQSFVSNNIAGDSGGGLYARSSSTTFEISQTTISANIARTTRGGGLYIREGATANVQNSTISGNKAAGESGLTSGQGNGGGIYVGGPIASYLTLGHVTVTDNEAAGNGGGLDINRDDIGDVITITNSIVAGNIDTGGYPDCHAYETSSYDLIVDSTNLFGGTAGDDCIPGVSDLSLISLTLTISDVLSPLADNDGLEAGSTLSETVTIPTHALLLNSPAINASSSSDTADQRGVSRPQGSANDIGAFEAEFPELSITFSGSGDGSISGMSTACTTDCSEAFFIGTTVTLTAAADSGSNFNGWSGPCSGSDACVVTLDEAKSVTAIFNLIGFYTLLTDTDGDGSGSVSRSPDAESYTEGTVVTLSATADTGSTFTGWTEGCPIRSGACRAQVAESCSGTGDCVVTMDYSRYIIATFEQDIYILSVDKIGDGTGTVTKSPDSPTYTYGTVVTLTATADDGSVFSAWADGCPTRSPDCGTTTSNPCGEAEQCVITMTNTVAVSAIFSLEALNLNQPPDGETVDTTKPEFDWGGVFDDPAEIISYTIIITNSEGVTHTFTTTDTTFEPTTGLPADSYEWTVIGNKSDGSTIEADETFSFTIAPSIVYLPFMGLEPIPACELALPLVADGVTKQSVGSIHEIFYSSDVAVPRIHSQCDVYLSSSGSEISPILVDDVLQLFVGAELIFEHDFSQTGSLVAETIALPESVVAQMSQHTVTVTLKDRYDYQISSTPLYLVSDSD